MPLIVERDIKTRLAQLVGEIAEEASGQQLVVVIGLLKGSFMFLADMARLFYIHSIPLAIDFMMVSSYGAGTESSGRVEMTRDITTSIENQWTLLVDDILDTGRTMEFAEHHLRQKRPSKLKTCVLLDKPDRRVVPFHADYVGFTIPDEFVVGYGLDHNGRYRELPNLSVLSDKP